MFKWYVFMCGSKNEYEKACVWKRLGLSAWNLLTILGWIVNIIEEHAWPFNEHINLHFDIEIDNVMSSLNHEESNYAFNLELLIVLF